MVSRLAEALSDDLSRESQGAWYADSLNTAFSWKMVGEKDSEDERFAPVTGEYLRAIAPEDTVFSGMAGR